MTTRKKTLLRLAAAALFAAALLYMTAIIFGKPNPKADELKALGDDLAKAVEREDYEAAARLRDDIHAAMAEQEIKKLLNENNIST